MNKKKTTHQQINSTIETYAEDYHLTWDLEPLKQLCTKPTKKNEPFTARFYTSFVPREPFILVL